MKKLEIEFRRCWDVRPTRKTKYKQTEEWQTTLDWISKKILSKAELYFAKFKINRPCPFLNKVRIYAVQCGNQVQFSFCSPSEPFIDDDFGVFQAASRLRKGRHVIDHDEDVREMILDEGARREIAWLTCCKADYLQECNLNVKDNRLKDLIKHASERTVI